MESITKRTNVTPLLMRFTSPQVPEVVKSEDYMVYYDPKTQITMFMGGGGGKRTESDRHGRRTDFNEGAGTGVRTDYTKETDD